MKYKLVFAIVFSVWSMNANAGGWITDDGTAVIQFVNTENSIVRIHYTSETSKNPDGCQNTTSLILKSDNPMFDQHYSLLLSAFMANKKIKVYGNGCYSAWGSTYPVISAIYAYK